MAGELDASGTFVKGIEDYLPSSQYERSAHQNKVVEDIRDNWVTLSQGNKFHAIFATSSIPEAITYYRLIKEKCPTLKITALFDPNEDNGGNSTFKTQGLVEILEDYNHAYDQKFDLAAHAKFKKDVSARLAHKAAYKRIETLAGIPLEAYEYVINGKSALEWIMDRYQVKQDKDSKIVNDPNKWCEEHENPRYIVDLIKSIVTVSLATNEIVRGLPKI